MKRNDNEKTEKLIICLKRERERERERKESTCEKLMQQNTKSPTKKHAVI